MSLYNQLIAEFDQLADADKAKHLMRFFKTGKGDYGEGDLFLGITVPEQRKLVRKYKLLDDISLSKLIKSKYHEHRLTGLLILTQKYESTKTEKTKYYRMYIDHINYVNNWDLVDTTCHKVVGHYLLNNKKIDVLYKMAKSDHLWTKRIAIVSTYHFIKNGILNPTIKISNLLLNDSHDLIHKAVGWMLRELGKQDENLLRAYLEDNAKKMPRTMLRYAIERLKDRKYYLNL